MRRRRLVLIGLALLVVLPAATARGARRSADKVWASPDLGSRTLRTIAILPPMGASKAGGAAFEDVLFLRVFKDGHVWLPSAFTMDYMFRNPREGQPILDRLRGLADPSDGLDSARAAVLGRALRADAFLLLRVERWERTGDYRTVARVEAMCALVDSSGHVLLKVSGAEEVPGVLGIPRQEVGFLPVPTPERVHASQDLTFTASPDWAPSSRILLAQNSQTAPPTPRMTEREQSKLFGDPARTGGRTSVSQGRGSGSQWGAGGPSPAAKLSPDFDLALRRLLDRWLRLFPKAGTGGTAGKS